MKAIVIARFGGPEVLELREVADPTSTRAPGPGPARGEVRVRVRATAVNRADLLQRAGHYPAPPDAPPDIPGLEYAGEVDAIGDGVTGLACGDRVFGLCGGGSYAEALVVPERTAVKIPERLSFVEAAAIPEAFITAWDAMVVQGRLGAGEWALIHAVGSGVGSAAVQIARAIGARVAGTSRTQGKLDRAKALGLDEAIVVADGAFAAEVRRVTAGAGVDLVLDLVGGSYVAEDLACLAPRGRILLVGLTGGARAELDLAAILNRRAQLIGTVLRARPLEEKIAAVQLLARHLVPLFAAGRLHPVIDRVLPLARAAEAHAVVASNATFGKVVLEIA